MPSKLLSLTLYSLAALTLVNLVHAADPSITFISPDQVKNIGDTAELVCIVKDAQYIVQWGKVHINNNKFVLSFFTIFLTYSSSSL